MALRPHGPLGAWLSGPAGGVGSRGSACKQSEAGSRRTRRRGLFLATRSSYGARSSMMKIIMETSTWPPVPLLSRPHLPGTRVKSRHRGAVRLDFGLRSWRQSDPSTHRARRCAKALQGKSGQRVKKIVEILILLMEGKMKRMTQASSHQKPQRTTLILALTPLCRRPF